MSYIYLFIYKKKRENTIDKCINVRLYSCAESSF